MVRNQTIAAIAVALLLLAAVVPGAAALSDPATQTEPTENETSVNVTTGQQLSTVLSVTSEDVQSEVEETSFEVEYENASAEQRAEVLAERADVLRERAAAIRDDYESVTEAYREGELTRSDYAQRLATLNARAENVIAAYDRFAERADTVSALDRRVAGVNRTAVEVAVENLDSVRGTGAAALLQRFTGERQGEVELETANGLSIEVESGDGARSREFERPGDGSTELSVSQSAALDTAKSTLTDRNGSWVLTKAKIHDYRGTYEFRYRLDSAATEGEYRVTVDGSSGDVIAYEEELEPRDEDSDDDRRENESTAERDLALVVTDGTVGANETVTVQVLAGGAPASNVPVSLDGRTVGTTDANGTVTVRLPAAGEVKLRARSGEREGELELEFADDEREDREISRNLRADAALDDGVLTVTVTYDGSGVSDASVYANGERAGTTGSDGVATFRIPNGTEDLDVTVVKGEFEAEWEYETRGGTLTRTEGPDDDYEREESGEREEEEEHEENDGDDETETPESTDAPEADDDDERDADTPEAEDDDGDGTPEPTDVPDEER